MPDSAEIDDALTVKLRSDATLAGLMPDGVWIDEAPANSKRFVIVSLVDEHDDAMFGARAFEDATYLVKAVALSSVTADMKAAAARIDALLEYGTLTITGYGLMVLRRESRIRFTEVDEVDRSVRWFHRGGRYQVVAST